MFKLLNALVLVVPTLVSVANAAFNTRGIDVSDPDQNIPWRALNPPADHFAYIKATEGTSYTNPQFEAQYGGAVKAGVVRGAYHSAVPNESSGREQAFFFIANSEGWIPGELMLPGALELQDGPNDKCYGLNEPAMTTWIKDFSDTYHVMFHRFPVIYTTIDWWKTCTANADGFQENNPLWIVRQSFSPGELPAGYKNATFWQYADSSFLFKDVFNGEPADLQRFAKGPLVGLWQHVDAPKQVRLD